MSRARKLLLFGGIVLMILGMSYGLWYAVFAEHQALDRIGGSLEAGFSSAANRNSPGVDAALGHYREAKYVYDRQVDVHSHWIGLAMLLVILGIAFDQVGFSESVKSLLAWGLLLGAFLFPLGVLLQSFSHASFPRAVAIAGSALVVACLACVVLGIARGTAAR
jgi:hypothetical protein